METLQLPEAQLRRRIKDGIPLVFDIFRNKWVKHTPEEDVRQHLLHHLVNDKQYPKGLIAVERELKINGLKRRYDAVCYLRNGQPHILVECKAPDVKITNETFMQIAHYNTVVKVPYLLVSNGLMHYACMVDINKGTVHFLKEIPEYPVI